jgi:hypothetical protein
MDEGFVWWLWKFAEHRSKSLAFKFGLIERRAEEPYVRRPCDQRKGSGRAAPGFLG